MTRKKFWQKIQQLLKCFFQLKGVRILQQQKNSPLMWIFFRFKSCTIMAFINLLKLHALENSGSLIKSKMLLANQIAELLLISQKILQV